MRHAFGCLFATLLLLGPGLVMAGPREVTVTQGTLVGQSNNGVAVFRGIPFAAPPVGVRRWAPPEPPAGWSGKRLATDFSPACMQQPYPEGSMFVQPSRPTSEDCLYLNVWTRNLDNDTPAPVMVWIHGGGLTRGSGATALYDGTALTAKGVVVVTINYRLDVFGYMAHPELTRESPNRASGNYGTLDQVAALKWVKDNIARFGGDPETITIFGESAGSWSVNHMTATPLAAGLFQRAIGQSGGGFAPMAELKRNAHGKDSAESEGRQFAKDAGARRLSDLRAMTAAEILATAATSPARVSQPVVDGWVFPEQIADIFAAGRHNKVDLIVGSNADEGTNLLPPPRDPVAAMAILTEMVGTEHIEQVKALYHHDLSIAGPHYGYFRDVVFTWQMREWARRARAHNENVYRYYFSYRPSQPLDGRLGAFHAAEIAYVFDNAGFFHRALGKPPEARDATLGARMSDYWVSFVKTGVPSSPDGPDWPRFEIDTDDYLEFNEEITPRVGLMEERLDLIGEIVGAQFDD